MTINEDTTVEVFSLTDSAEARFAGFLDQFAYAEEPEGLPQVPGPSDMDEDDDITEEEKVLLSLIETKYDESPVGTPGGRQNWVDKVGGLPKFIRAIAHALIRNGRSESQAIQLAVGAVKRWARGGDNVTPKTRAKAVAALAEWEAKKGASHAKSDTLQHAIEIKARHVRTAAGVRRFGQPIGTIIVRDSLALSNLRVLDPVYQGFTHVAGKDKKKYDVGWDADNDVWVATGHEGGWDDVIAEADSEDAVFEALDAHVAKSVGTKKPRGVPVKKAPDKPVEKPIEYPRNSFGGLKVGDRYRRPDSMPGYWGEVTKIEEGKGGTTVNVWTKWTGPDGKPVEDGRTTAHTHRKTTKHGGFAPAKAEAPARDPKASGAFYTSAPKGTRATVDGEVWIKQSSGEAGKWQRESGGISLTGRMLYGRELNSKERAKAKAAEPKESIDDRIGATTTHEAIRELEATLKREDAYRNGTTAERDAIMDKINARFREITKHNAGTLKPMQPRQRITADDRADIRSLSAMAQARYEAARADGKTHDEAKRIAVSGPTKPAENGRVTIGSLVAGDIIEGDGLRGRVISIFGNKITTDAGVITARADATVSRIGHDERFKPDNSADAKIARLEKEREQVNSHPVRGSNAGQRAAITMEKRRRLEMIDRQLQRLRAERDSGKA